MRHWVASAFIGLVAFSLALSADSVYAEEVLLDSPGDGSFIVPNNVNELTVELWGAGGAGGDVSSGGGGGGAYRSGTLTVNPGESLPYHVGRGARSESEVPGETSWFGSPGALSAGGGSSARNRGTRQGGSGSNAGTYAGGDGGSGAWLVGGGGGSSAGREQDGNPGSGSSSGNAPAGGGDGGAGGGSIFIFGGSGEPGEQPGGGGGGAGSGLFGGGSGGSGGDGLIRLVYTAEGGCDASFPDGISSYNGGNIDFGYNSQLIGSPDGTLSAGNISRNGGSNVGTCGSVDCEAEGSAASPLNLPPFPTIGAPADSSVWVGYNQSVTVGDGGNRFESISTGYLSTLTFSSDQDTYYIGALNLGSSSQVYLQPGDYYIESISINSQVDVQVLGSGTARLFINDSVNLGSPSSFNSPGVDQAGDASKLLLASYSDVYLQNNATLSGAVFALGDINLGSSSYLYGGATAENITLGTDSRLYFQDQGLSNIDFGGTCPGGGDEVVDHFEIVHGGTGLTCSPASVTIRACDDASCSQTFSKPVAVTLAPSGWVGGDTFTFTGQANRSLRVTDAGTVSLGVTGSDPGSEGATLCGTNSDDLSAGNCEMTFYDSGFAISVPDHVADTEVQATIAAVRKNKETEQCVPGFSEETKAVALWSDYVNPKPGTLNVWVDGDEIPTSQGETTNLTFDADGVATETLRYPDAGKVRLHAQYIGTGEEAGLMMEGNGDFVARPDHFELEIPDNPAAEAVEDDNDFVAAGADFEIRVKAINASGNVTPNFGQETSPESVELAISLVAPSREEGYEPPELKGAFNAFGEGCNENPGTSGVACGQFNWLEVGIISIEPSLAGGSYLGTEDVVGKQEPYVGRFIPHHFSINPDGSDFGTIAMGCTGADVSFTYSGEGMGWSVAPAFRIVPKAKAGEETQNYYHEPFMRLVDSSVQLGWPEEDDDQKLRDGTTSYPVTVTSNNGAIAHGDEGPIDYQYSSTIDIVYDKSVGARLDPFGPELSFRIAEIKDQDEVVDDFSTSSDDNIEVNDDGDHEYIFSPSAEDDGKIFYGRLVLDNAYGPGDSELPIPMRVEYFKDSDAGFVINEQESCWTYNLNEDVFAPDFEESDFDAGDGISVVDVSDTDLNLEKGIPEVDSSASPPIDNRVRLAPPSVNKVEGSDKKGILVKFNLGGAEYLKDFWDPDNPNTPKNPSAWATFGVYRGNDRIIYWHEVLN